MAFYILDFADSILGNIFQTHLNQNMEIKDSSWVTVNIFLDT